MSSGKTVMRSLALLALLFFAAAGHAEIRVGIAGPLSGSTLTIGEQQEMGALLAIDHLNEEGGLLEQEVVAVSVDDACDAYQAEAVARQLISEDVDIVIGHLCSGCSLAVSKLYEEAGIIMMSPASTNPRVTDEGGANIFRVIGRDDHQGTIAGNFLADYYPDRNIAIIHDSEPYGIGLAGYAKKQLNRRGISEKAYAGYQRDQANYGPLVNKLVDNQINIVYAGGYLADIGIILRQAKKLLPDLRLVSGDSLAHAEFLVIAGNGGIGTYFTFGQDMRKNPAAAGVVSAFRKNYDYEPEGYTLYSYGAVQAWAQAVKKAGSVDTKPVIDILKTQTFDTVLGQIGFDEKGDVTGMSPFVWYVFGDKNYRPVEAADLPN